MRVVVQKYGGSSVADLDKIQGVARRIAHTVADGTRLVAVVSAMGNTTNELIALARQAAVDPDRRELDMLISVGERVTMALLAMTLRDMGVRARSLTGSQSGIITDEAHADARVVEVRAQRLLDTVADGTVAIVAGFQGVSRAREVTTLGRGGSDTTAVVLAAALGADHCEICSDVDGVWSADPRVVRDAHKIDQLSLDEGLALARGGAKVLFEDAVRYARDKGVDIVAASTFGPGSGTRLTKAPVAGPPRATAVTGDTQLARVVVAPTDAAALEALAAAGVRVRAMDDGEALLDLRNAHGALPVPSRRVARVTAVGTGLGERPRDRLPAWEALAAAGVRVERSGAAGDSAWWEVPSEQVDVAVSVVHAALVAPVS